MGTRKHRALVRSRRLLLFDPSVKGRSFATCERMRVAAA